jgi:hypothetical protein
LGKALRGDLGWLSIKFQVALAKLKFLRHLCRLPQDRLLKKVFLHRKNQYDQTCLTLHMDTLKDGSWYSEISEILANLGLQAGDWSVAGIERMSKQEWGSGVEKLIFSCDSRELFSSFPRTSSGIHYSQIKRTPRQANYIWKHDRKSATIKFALRSRSYGLQARFHQKAGAVQFGKACKLCATGEDETEEHHLLRCPVFFRERVAFCDALTRQSKDDFPQEYSDFSASSGMLQTAYLLGRTEPHWAPSVSTIIDMLIRPYLIALAIRRKALMKDVD